MTRRSSQNIGITVELEESTFLVIPSAAMKAPKYGCILATFFLSAFLLTVYFEFLSHHGVESKLGILKGGNMHYHSFIDRINIIPSNS